MSIFSMTWPAGTQAQMQAALDGYMNNLAGRDCILYFPPIKQPCPSGQGENVHGDIPNSYWVTGNPQWGHTMQSCGYCGGEGFITVEQTGVITMVVYDKISQFNKLFPVGERHHDGMIVTRGFVTDVSNVMNCTRMQTYNETGTNIYDFILAGEPRFPSKIIPNRYFYCLWQRL